MRHPVRDGGGAREAEASGPQGADPRPRSPHVRVNHYLTPAQFRRLNVLVQVSGRDRSSLVRQALDAYLHREDRPWLSPPQESGSSPPPPGEKRS